MTLSNLSRCLGTKINKDSGLTFKIFSKASMINQDDGLASYWIAKSYEKKDGKDYDLIIEAYEDSLSKKLPEKLRKDAQASKEAANNKKKTFNNFWK